MSQVWEPEVHFTQKRNLTYPSYRKINSRSDSSTLKLHCLVVSRESMINIMWKMTTTEQRDKRTSWSHNVVCRRQIHLHLGHLNKITNKKHCKVNLVPQAMEHTTGWDYLGDWHTKSKRVSLSLFTMAASASTLADCWTAILLQH